jgi:PglZ domain
MGIIAEHIQRKLEKDIREKGLLIWLDKENEFTPFVDSLIQNRGEGNFPYDVYAFRGSFLQFMIESKEILSGKIVPKCLIHMPRFNEQEIRETPLLEAYKAGQRWRVSLETMIKEAAQGRLTQEQTEFLLEKKNLTLSLAEEYISQEERIPQEIKSLLQKYGEDGFVLNFLYDPERIYNELCVDAHQCFRLLTGYFETLVGLDEEWRRDWNPDVLEYDYTRPENQADLLISYLMAMEFVHDLKENPQSPRLTRLLEKSKLLFQKSSTILKELRERQPLSYIDWAQKVEANLSEEECAHNSKALGSLDTFRFEADIFLNEAMTRLKSGLWTEALDLAMTRLPNNKNSIAQTFWLQQDKQRLWLWQWIETASQMGHQIDEASTQMKQILADSNHHTLIDLYSSSWWRIDQLHRGFCSASDQYQSSNTDLHYASFITIRTKLQLYYRDCIDDQSVIWNSICEQEGFLPEEILQQRFFYKNWVAPVLPRNKKTALFLVDGLRYELGIQLQNILKDIKPKITPLLAELPSVTAIGMNALSPVVKGDMLTPLLDNRNRPIGFKGGARQVISPADRKKTYEDNVGQEVSWATLHEFSSLTDRKLKKFINSQFVVIAVPDIDEMGEAGALKLGLDHFNTTLVRIKNAIEKLKAQGYEEFIITADHGFLLGDETLKTKRSPRLGNVERRHAFDSPRNSETLISVSPQQLNYEMEDRSRSFIFDRTTHILNANGKEFYHGGNTLQERLIPVLTFSYTRQLKDNSGIFDMLIEKAPTLMGFDHIIVTPKAKGDFLFALASIEVELLTDKGIKLDIQDVGGANRNGNILTLSVNEKTEILFKLSRGDKPKGQISLVATQSDTVLENAEFQEFFDVADYQEKDSEESGVEQKNEKHDLSNEIPQEFHTALQHLKKHGSLTEQYLINTLGGGSLGNRKARRFANKIDSWLPLLPFDIVIEQTAEGKVYKTK